MRGVSKKVRCKKINLVSRFGTAKHVGRYGRAKQVKGIKPADPRRLAMSPLGTSVPEQKRVDAFPEQAEGGKKKNQGRGRGG